MTKQKKIKEKQKTHQTHLDELLKKKDEAKSQLSQVQKKHQLLKEQLTEMQKESSDPAMLVDAYTQKVKKERQQKQN